MTQQWDPAPDSAEIDAATARLLVTARTLSDADVLAPSALPGWTRGHVLTHVARNADSMVNLLTWAATGVEHPQYPYPGARNEAIDAGARRPIAAQLADLQSSAQRFREAVATVPPENWHNEVRWSGGDPRPASKILDSRLREVAVHHIDLDAGYSASDWPPVFALRILIAVVPAFEARGMAAVTLVAHDLEEVPGVDEVVLVNGGSKLTVYADAHQLVTWLLGRSSSADVEWTGGRELPIPPAWV